MMMAQNLVMRCTFVDQSSLSHLNIKISCYMQKGDLRHMLTKKKAQVSLFMCTV